MIKKAIKGGVKKKKNRDVHIGDILTGYIKKEGLKKQFIADKLNVSRPWLNTLLKTGKFNSSQLLIIKKIMS